VLSRVDIVGLRCATADADTVIPDALICLVGFRRGYVAQRIGDATGRNIGVPYCTSTLKAYVGFGPSLFSETLLMTLRELL
jgi:hypothetical protein